MSEQKKPPEQAGQKPPDAPAKKDKGGPPSATEPEGQLRPELQAVQAAHAQPAPERVPLVLPGKDEMGQPEATPPLPPAPAKAVPAPRVVHENERAPEGLARFKIRALNYGLQPSQYVLAADERAAREHYVRANALDKVAEVMGESAPEPVLSVRRLPD